MARSLLVYIAVFLLTLSLRGALSQPHVMEDQRQQLRMQVQHLVDSEIALARSLFAVASQDSRIGYEASNHYYYVPQDLVEKVINCDFLRNKFSNGDH